MFWNGEARYDTMLDDGICEEGAGEVLWFELTGAESTEGQLLATAGASTTRLRLGRNGES